MAREQSDRDDRPADRRQEGVRIIPADEAQAALDAGQVAGRRSEDQLRFGDVPPAPTGPRPPHRFPLPDSVDPAAAVPRPPLAAPVHSEERAGGGVRTTRAIDPAPGDPSPAAAPAVEAPAGQTVAAGTDDGSSDPTGLGDPPGWDTGPADPAGAAPAAWPLGGIPAGEAHEPTAPHPATNDPDYPAATPSSEPAWPVVAIPEEPPRLPDPPRSIWDDPAARPWATATPPTPTFAGPGSAPADGPPPPAADFPQTEPAPPEEGITLSGSSGTDMPHWTDPPTGEVPRILSDEPAEDEDLAAWQALGSRGMRWRDEGDDWDDAPLEDLGDEQTRVGALDTSRTEHSDLYSFDEDFSRLEEERSGAHPVIEDDYDDYQDVPVEPEVVGVGGRGPRPDPRPPRPRGGGGGVIPGGGGGELTNRVIVGVGLVALLLIAWAIGPKALVVLSALVVLAATAEAYGMLQRSGFRPATLLGLVVAVGTVLGAYWRGIEVLPLASVLMFVGSMLWYLWGIAEARPLANVAVTTMTFMWTGLLGSFAALLLREPHGAGLFIGPVLAAVAADVAAFLVGGRVGTRPLAPNVSPGKTVEGFFAGLVAAVVVGAIVGKELTPWGGIKHGLVLGVLIGLLAPVGDLFESMVKRDLSVKDSGSVLPGHGGLLDRFDSILLILPVAFYVAFWFKL